ncbi:hypothetical protein [Natronosalvus caseinilyticus]|uniref:hypothetical protein n=1 Tax=Natronosalvus caseinilyticus TaxID=2953747 RepID=UPI0028B090E9|nr:hypothetical protein [Natronosalvus caseinilyticus]
MNRRDVLLAGGVTGATMISGCSSVGERSGKTTEGDDASDGAETGVKDTSTGSGEPDPPTFEITEFDSDERVAYDDVLEVDTMVTNTGGKLGDDTVTLEFSGTVIDTGEVSLEPEETVRTMFTLDAAAHNSGVHEIEVSTADDVERRSVTIEREPEPAAFDIDNVRLPSEVNHDESIDIVVAVTNVGERPGEDTMTVSFAGTEVSRRSIEADAGAMTEIDVSVGAERTEHGVHVVEVRTSNDATSSTITVENPNPWRKETLTVGLEQRVPARHDIHDIVRDALEYWDVYASNFTEFDVSYEFRANAGDPDIMIVLVEEIDRCGEHTGNIAGCAPLVRGRAPETAEVRIVEGYRPEWLTSTLKHELGHTLGLTHDDEPAHIMSNEIEDRIPNYDIRIEAVERYADSIGPFGDGTRSWSAAIDAWSDQDLIATEEYAVDAYNELGKAKTQIDRSKNLVDGLKDETDAMSLLSESHTRIDTLQSAADEAIDMAREARNGNYGAAEDHRNRANEYLDESNSFEFESPSELAFALGFRRQD